MISRIYFRRAATAKYEVDPSPLIVKRVFDRELLDNGVRFITGSPACDLLVDERGELALARALWACGDYEGMAIRILTAYRNDPRGAFAEYVASLLSK